MDRFHRRVSTLLYILIVSFGIPLHSFAQGGIRVTAEVDQTSISTDDLLTLTLTVDGDYQQLGEPQLPLLSEFSIVGNSRSSQFSMVNGVVTSRAVFHYRLKPTGSGVFTLDPLAINVDGSEYRTDPITLHVNPGVEPTDGPEPTEATGGEVPTSPYALDGQDFFVESDVDNPAPFLGQQVVYRFRFYQAVNLFAQPRLELPTFSGFWTEELQPNRVYEHFVADRRYRVTEVRQALFPTSASQVIIPPAVLTIPGDLFKPDELLQTDSVNVNVRPLPVEAPDGFAGAVGQYEIEAWTEPDQTRVNEPVTLFVRIHGSGNVDVIPDPTAWAEARLSDWRVYDPQTTVSVSPQDDIVKGEKLLERLLVPKTAGDLMIDAFALVYFDPEALAYRQAQTEPLVVKVAPAAAVYPGLSGDGDGKLDVTMLANDIRHIKTAPPSLATRTTRLVAQPVYWISWLVPLIGVAGAFVLERRRRRLTTDLAFARARRARRLAQKGFDSALELARENEQAAYATVARTLLGYLGDKLNLASAGLTRDFIHHTLADRLVSEHLIQRTLSCLDWADSGRFAPVAAGRTARELVAEAESIVAELELNMKSA